MPQETVFCEMCFTNPSHAHVRDMPICTQCIDEYKFARAITYLDVQPYETLDGQRLTESAAMEHQGVACFNPRNSAELAAELAPAL